MPDGVVEPGALSICIENIVQKLIDFPCRSTLLCPFLGRNSTNDPDVAMKKSNVCTSVVGTGAKRLTVLLTT